MDIDDTTTVSSIDQSRTSDHYTNHEDLSLDWLLILVSLGTLVADIYIITIIRKYKSLQNYRNLLILRAIWFHLGYTMLGDTLALVISIVSSGLKSEGFCFVRNLDYLCLGMVYFLLTFLAVEWYISQYHSGFHERYRRIFIRGLLVCFCVILPEALLTSFYCFKDEATVDMIRYVLKNGTFFLCLVTVTVMFMLKWRRPLPADSRKFEYCFTVSFVFLFMCLPTNIDNILRSSYYYVEDQLYRNILLVLSDIAFAIFLSASVVMVFVLSKASKHFKVAYMRCCKKKKTKTYTDDNLDDEDSSAEEQTNSVSYDKGLDSVQLNN